LGVAAFSGSGVFPQKSQDFSIEEIKVRIYDNQKDSVINEPSNPYGNDMDIFLSVKIKQIVNSEKSYIIKVEGFGKGRDNEAEGLVKDHKIKTGKEIKIYSDMSLFVPFILDFPCVDETTYTVTVTEKGSGKKAVKNVKTKLGFCYLN
jgi:hypothetical protein